MLNLGGCYIFQSFCPFLPHHSVQKYLHPHSIARRPIQVVYSLCEFWQIMSFKELVQFTYVIVFMAWSYYSFTVILMFLGSVVHFLSFLTVVICILSLFLLVSLARGLLIVFIFSNNQHLALLMLSDFLFSLSLFWL